MLITFLQAVHCELLSYQFHQSKTAPCNPSVRCSSIFVGQTFTALATQQLLHFKYVIIKYIICIYIYIRCNRPHFPVMNLLKKCPVNQFCASKCFLKKSLRPKWQHLPIFRKDGTDFPSIYLKYGGSIAMGGTPTWLVYNGKTQSKMDVTWGTPMTSETSI